MSITREKALKSAMKIVVLQYDWMTDTTNPKMQCLRGAVTQDIQPSCTEAR